MSQKELIDELVDAIDLSKLDKRLLARELLKAVDPEKLIEIINQHNDEPLDKALDDTAKQSRRAMGWLISWGKGTVQNFADNYISRVIRTHWPKQSKNSTTGTGWGGRS